MKIIRKNLSILRRLVVFCHERDAIETVSTTTDEDLLYDKLLYISYTRFLLHWLKSVKNMEEQCV